MERHANEDMVGVIGDVDVLVVAGGGLVYAVGIRHWHARPIIEGSVDKNGGSERYGSAGQDRVIEQVADIIDGYAVERAKRLRGRGEDHFSGILGATDRAGHIHASADRIISR